MFLWLKPNAHGLGERWLVSANLFNVGSTRIPSNYHVNFPFKPLTKESANAVIS